VIFKKAIKFYFENGKECVSTSVRKFIFYVSVDGVVNTVFKELKVAHLTSYHLSDAFTH
jgi:hypothetical protein